MRWTVHGVPRVPWDAEGIFDGISTFRLDRKGKIYEHQVRSGILDPVTAVAMPSCLHAAWAVEAPIGSPIAYNSTQWLRRYCLRAGGQRDLARPTHAALAPVCRPEPHPAAAAHAPPALPWRVGQRGLRRRSTRASGAR